MHFILCLLTFHSGVCIICQVKQSFQRKNLQFNGIQENNDYALSVLQTLFVDSSYVSFPVKFQLSFFARVLCSGTKPDVKNPRE